MGCKQQLSRTRAGISTQRYAARYLSSGSALRSHEHILCVPVRALPEVFVQQLIHFPSFLIYYTQEPQSSVQIPSSSSRSPFHLYHT